MVIRREHDLHTKPSNVFCGPLMLPPLGTGLWSDGEIGVIVDAPLMTLPLRSLLLVVVLVMMTSLVVATVWKRW